VGVDGCQLFYYTPRISLYLTQGITSKLLVKNRFKYVPDVGLTNKKGQLVRLSFYV
jgi:hypothetical protein